MALIAAWEAIAVDDLGPGAAEGTRSYKITTVAETPDGTLHMVAAICDLTPEQLENWRASMDGKRVQP